MKYIDCDGVILDTETGIFDEYYRILESNPDYTKREYLEKLNWYEWILQAPVLNDSINIINNYDPRNATILTKFNTIPEAEAKVGYLRDAGIKNNIIIVPSSFQKSMIVKARGNILVDNEDSNLYDWENNGGIPFSFGPVDSVYPKLDSLEDVLNPQKLVRVKRDIDLRIN